jgi:hypothetical protein
MKKDSHVILMPSAANVYKNPEPLSLIEAAAGPVPDRSATFLLDGRQIICYML